MKRLTLILAGALLTGGAAAAQPGPTFGSHGMALFGGKDALYASHLPMFHAPHDYQVVLQVHVADPKLDAALRQRLDGKTALWTIDPEKFELDRLAPNAAAPVREFKADLVDGHFERGGKTQYAGATVVVDKVLVFRKLSADAAKRDSARYVQLGSGKQRYLVKEIDSRPDFDHIVAITSPAGASGAPVVLAKQGLDETAADTLTRALPGAKVTGTVYFDTADLK
ncbi:hypothetical protein HHL21_19455 [Massilia sp. RP-1-19]|uniref:Uncharacterized protein n=1 Tax=Massilia polaris TaxID=2728846 RepID=A0A848HU54_9BURK|nr:hypothetical protein [Massilia polaris]NML63221.1 hypothetical protein [Massilia polaris]